MLAGKFRNKDGTLRTFQQIAEDANVGLATAKKIAREANAVVRIGRLQRVDPEKFYEYIDKNLRE